MSSVSFCFFPTVGLFEESSSFGRDQKTQEAKPSHGSIFNGSAGWVYVTSAHIPLARASHMATPLIQTVGKYILPLEGRRNRTVKNSGKIM